MHARVRVGVASIQKNGVNPGSSMKGDGSNSHSHKRAVSGVWSSCWLPFSGIWAHRSTRKLSTDIRADTANRMQPAISHHTTTEVHCILVNVAALAFVQYLAHYCDGVRLARNSQTPLRWNKRRPRPTTYIRSVHSKQSITTSDQPSS
jgi:hypothetical protein